MAEQAVTFQDYLGAVSQLASDAQMSIIANPQTRALVRGYDAYLKTVQPGQTVQTFDQWVDVKANVKTALNLADENAAGAADIQARVTEAKNYMNAPTNQQYKRVKDQLFQTGTYVMQQAKSFLERAWDTIKENKFGLGLGLLGLLGGQAMDFGLFGSLALAAVGVAVGGGLIDENGLLSGLFGGNRPRTTVSTSPNIITQGRPAPAYTAGPAIPELTGEKKFAETKVDEYTPAVPIADAPNGRQPNASMQIRTEDGRTIQILGINEGGKFKPIYMNLGTPDPNDPKKFATETGFMIPEGTIPELTVEAGGKVKFTTETSNAIIRLANNVNTRRPAMPSSLPPAGNVTTLPEAQVGTPVSMKDVQENQLVELKIKNGNNAVTVRGKRNGNKFIIEQSSTTLAGSTPTAMEALARPIEITLDGDNLNMDPGAALTAVNNERTRANRELVENFANGRNMNVSDISVAPQGTATNINMKASFQRTGSTDANERTTPVDVSLRGVTFDTTTRVMTVPVVTIGGNVENRGNISINLGAAGAADSVDFEKLKTGDQAELQKLQAKLNASTELSTMLRSNMDVNVLPATARTQRPAAGRQ